MLIERLERDSIVLEIGTGSGRNTRALLDAGIAVTTVEDDAERAMRAAAAFENAPCTVLRSAYTQIPAKAATFDGALSTHAFLHGTTVKIATMVRTVALLLKSGGLFYATFGSTHDARYGKGDRVEEQTFAPASGEEQGIPHAYFTQEGLRALLEPWYAIESVSERNVDDVVGAWAHPARPAGSVHWFVRSARI
ncbi:MAG TPA: methyltransferase domain-containing protein [Vicinamibacterales bacterium]|jgi:cyclopropane fatty-acyl-phospholipid synthase-like methyltransferase|nr:methyltransferase domain-containing protein [Vicinamibacterales bacterium]